MVVQHFAFGPGSAEVFTIAQLTVLIFALFLMTLSISSYRKTGLKKIVYVIIAFALFATQHIINYIDGEVVDFLSDDMRHAIFAVISVVIMVMFFLAIIKK